MRKFACALVALLLSQMICLQLYAQNATISGNVKAVSSKENAAAVSVTVKNSSVGTYTDDKGNFNLSIQKLPVTIVFSGIGFETKKVEVNQSKTTLIVELNANNRLGQEVVVSASRVPEKILESPVSSMEPCK